MLTVVMNLKLLVSSAAIVFLLQQTSIGSILLTSCLSHFHSLPDCTVLLWETSLTQLPSHQLINLLPELSINTKQVSVCSKHISRHAAHHCICKLPSANNSELTVYGWITKYTEYTCCAQQGIQAITTQAPKVLYQWIQNNHGEQRKVLRASLAPPGDTASIYIWYDNGSEIMWWCACVHACQCIHTA